MFHVKQSDTDIGRVAERIGAGAERMGVVLRPGATELLARHLLAVVRSTGTLNLTAVRGAEEGVGLHVLDSLSACHAVETAPEGRLADLGSGGGFPGIPLCVATGRPVTLVESIRKKADFLERVVEELRIEAEVAAARSEELATTVPGGFACVVVRAVAELPVLVELAQPLLESGGLLVAMKGDPEPDELERGAAAGELCGMRFLRSEPVEVPGLHASRTLVVYKREGASTGALPRRPGMAGKRPLA